MRKSAGYIRVSTEEQAVNGYGVEVQREKIIQYCNLHDITNVELYIDEGYTGWSLERPALMRLLDDVRQGKIDKVIVYKSDRISRHLKDLLVLIEDVFEPNSVEFISVTENFDTGTAQGKLFLQMLGSFAEFERNLIKERTYAGKKQKAKQITENEIATGRVPTGYKKIGDTIVIDEQETQIVRLIFEMRRNGHSLREIANYLNQITNRKWYASTVRYILNNEKYLGKQIYKFKDETVEGGFLKIVA